MKKTVLREYAKLIAKAGANVQKGQEVFIRPSLTSRNSSRWWSTSAIS